MVDNKIYNLLNFLNDNLVNAGCSIKWMCFDMSLPQDIVYFSGKEEHKCGEDFVSFQKQYGYSDEEINK